MFEGYETLDSLEAEYYKAEQEVAEFLFRELYA